MIGPLVCLVAVQEPQKLLSEVLMMMVWFLKAIRTDKFLLQPTEWSLFFANIEHAVCQQSVFA